jgi:uncharacterized protein (TIGR02270 family)
MSVRHILKFVEQHSEDAAFLWVLRDQARIAADYTSRDLFGLDQRIEAHVDGLREAGSAGIDVAIGACADYPDPGELFTLAVLTLETPSAAGLREMVLTVERNPLAIRGVVSAIGWALRADLATTLPRLAREANPLVRMAAASLYSTRRIDPGNMIHTFFSESGPVRARALRLAGELGRLDLLPTVRQAVETLDGEERDWASWSGVLLGCRGPCLEHLKSRVGATSFGWRALQVVLTTLKPEEGRVWLSDAGRDSLALLIAGAGLIGEPKLCSWLADQMADPCLAPMAAESMMMITGDAVSVAEEDRREEPADPWLDLWMRSLPFPNAIAATSPRSMTSERGGRLLLGKPPLQADGPEVELRYRRIAELHRLAHSPGKPVKNFSERRISR